MNTGNDKERKGPENGTAEIEGAVNQVFEERRQDVIKGKRPIPSDLPGKLQAHNDAFDAAANFWRRIDMVAEKIRRGEIKFTLDDVLKEFAEAPDGQQTIQDEWEEIRGDIERILKKREAQQ